MTGSQFHTRCVSKGYPLGWARSGKKLFESWIQILVNIWVIQIICTNICTLDQKMIQIQTQNTKLMDSNCAECRQQSKFFWTRNYKSRIQIVGEGFEMNTSTILWIKNDLNTNSNSKLMDSN